MNRRSVARHADERRRAPGVWFTRVRAILAGGLVLGVGATLTLAAWTDTEHAQGTFEASIFNVVGSTDGVSFAEHPSDAPGTLTFTVEPERMSPGKTVYALFVVKTTAETNVGGTVQLTSASVTGSELAAKLTYGVKATTGGVASCNGSVSGDVVVAAGNPLTTASSTAQPLVAWGGTPAVAYCFAVTLASDASNNLQGKASTATWVFTATSSS